MSTLLTGAGVTALFAIIAYFLNRLITQNDRFQDETRRAHKVFGREITRNQSTLAEIKKEIETGSIDKETKREIKTLSKSLVEVQKELCLIKPALEKVEENYGKVIVLGVSLEAQEKKLKGLYDTLKVIIESKTGQR